MAGCFAIGGMLSFTGVEGVDFLSAFGILAATNMVNDWGVMVPTALTMRKLRYGKFLPKKDKDKDGAGAGAEGAEGAEQEVASRGAGAGGDGGLDASLRVAGGDNIYAATGNSSEVHVSAV